MDPNTPVTTGPIQQPLSVEGLLTSSDVELDWAIVAPTKGATAAASRPTQLRDGDIRRQLDSRLRSAHIGESGTLIRHELGLCAGKNRVDVAVINGEMAGYEIKSDEDTLVRLAAQADAYGRVLDRATVVTTERYLDKCTAALPAWWGIQLARHDGAQVLIDEIRPAAENSGHDLFSLAQLLWREEALEELRSLDKAKGLSKIARHYVWMALVEAMDLATLRAAVRRRLKARRDWPGGQ